VVERNVAEAAGIEVGDSVVAETARGPLRLRVVGIATNQQEEGTALYVPLTTVRELLGAPAGTSTYWIRMTSPDHALVDRTTTALEDRLGALGYEVGSEITYVAERDEIAENRSITTTITVLGFLIVAISMVGLANAITTSIIERMREIGVLRCIGARARDVRRIFATEGVAVALAGGLLGIPVGYVLARLMVRLVWEIVDVRMPFVFPLGNVPLVLAGTVVLALVVLLVPLRRAVRLRPGDALRYA
jgi:putative ABC transport system permease protein